MATVALDASVIIAFLDATDPQHDVAIGVLRPWLATGHSLLLPASVYAEILVQPMRLGLADTVDAFISEAGLQLMPLDRAIARRAARLRADYPSLRLPDAIALVTALVHQAQLLTFDQRLQRIAEDVAGKES